MTQEQLIHSTSILLARSREISRLKGENFNIFNVLQIERKEVMVHNRFLAHLLNPRGSHDMGAVFLNLFYDQLIQSINSEIPSAEETKALLERMKVQPANVKAEHWLGKKSADIKTGGSLDIFIKTSYGQLRIENKIDAGEQDDQVERYYNSERESDAKIIVVYLTLDGRDATTAGSLKSGEDYFCLSHRRHTTNWLAACLLQASDRPILRETIKQYLILIKKLTFQTTTHEMNKELESLITKNRESYESANAISNAMVSAQESVYKHIFSVFESEILRLSDIRVKINSKRALSTDYGFISLKSIVLETGTYDIGINLELKHNYFFFCAAESGKNRNQGFNEHNRFTSIADFLESKRYTCEQKGSRKGWNLCGTFSFNNSFSILKYLDLSDNERENLIKSIAGDVAQTIKESKVMEYSNTVSELKEDLNS
jgi:hypothetical protein